MLIERIKKYLRDNRALDYWEKEELTVEWYDVYSELRTLVRQNYNMWYAEYNRLLKEDRPRPHSMEKFFAIKTDKLAKKIATGSGLYLSVMESGSKRIMIKAVSNKCWNETIAITEMTI